MLYREIKHIVVDDKILIFNIYYITSNKILQIKYYVVSDNIKARILFKFVEKYLGFWFYNILLTFILIDLRD